MPKDRIVIEGEPGEYYLQWFLVEDGCLGGLIGQDGATEERLTDLQGEDWETAAIALEARHAAAVTNGNRSTRIMTLDAFLWERRSDAAAALKLIKAGVAARKANRPMPDWAVQALANGWKAPKGWTP